MDIKKIVLDNGIRIVTEKIPHVRSISLGVWLNAGSRDEPEASRGLSHFFEHMVFKGTEKRSAQDIATSLERVGGHLNAFTSKEIICFYAHVLDENFDIAFDVIADMIGNPKFATEDINKESGVVVEEIRSLKDVPEEYIHELLFRSFWPSHSLGRPIAGDEQTILGFSRKALVDFRKSVLSEGDIVVAAAGNLSHEMVEKAVTALLDYRCKTRMTRQTPPQEKPKRSLIKKDIQQAHLAVGFPGYHFSDMKKYPHRVLNIILGEGMGSRLFQEIREKHGLAYSVFSFFDYYSDAGITGIYAATDPAKCVKCAELIGGELRKLREKGITTDELDYAKSNLKGNLFLSLESTNGRMSRIARMELYQQRIESFDEISSKIEKISKEDVMEVIHDIFNPTGAAFSAIVPQGGPCDKEIFDVFLEKMKR